MMSLLRALIVVMPWPLKRWLLRRTHGYTLHRTSRIGLSWVFPRQLVMESHARIGHFTVCKGATLLSLASYASIGRLNWISAFPLVESKHFAHLTTRRAQLVLAEHAAITNRHIIDCTESISIGRFATVAGYRSQILTHSIDLAQCRQDAKSIDIGAYAFIGTACTLLGGAKIPDFSVVAACSLLHSEYDEPYRLYAGVPAKAVAELDPQLKYFTRSQGFVF
jgi:acetyltransferase-like isoleucine patch superfamily enzyme